IVDGRPVQIVDPKVQLELDEVDLTPATESERQGILESLIAGEVDRVFDLKKGSLIRAKLVRVSSLEHVLVLMIHHIVADGSSLALLVRELASLYSAYIVGEPAKGRDLELQYADYAAWQRLSEQGNLFEGQLSYWKGKLRGIPPGLDLARRRDFANGPGRSG